MLGIGTRIGTRTKISQRPAASSCSPLQGWISCVWTSFRSGVPG